MRSIKRSRINPLEILLLALIVLCFYIYFVVYLTPSRTSWYHEMERQMKIIYRGITHKL